MNSTRLRVLCLAISDFITFYGLLILVAWIYKKIDGVYEMSLYYNLWKVSLIFIVCNSFIKLYHGNVFYPGVSLNVVEEMRRIFFSVILTMLILGSYLILVKHIDIYSRFVITASTMLIIFFTPITRWFVRSILKKLALFETRCIIISSRDCDVKNVIDEIKKDRQMGLNVVKVKKALLSKRFLHSLRKYRHKYNISYAILIINSEELNNYIYDLSQIFEHIMIISPNQIGFSSSMYRYDLNGISGSELKNQLLLKGPRILKSITDYSFALITTIILLPFLLMITILVKITSPGPVFYKAKRLGIKGKEIKVLKFRTMHQDADERLQSLLDNDKELAKEWKANFKLENDPRITPLGNLLRITSLDELPQFFNVLKGDMSVIGPRPIVKKELEYYGNCFDLIKQVKPGITGFWQVSGRSNTTYSQRIRYDMYYITNWNLWLDYFIFLKTIKEVIFCKGAK
ncbi:exopolysaccharide biosynthesis polyprenyl glycosylphosphotransferase [Lentisphaerota bacterium WC36G]|nr:exopolysaccharide biosynthesis polyprenyl glycosylphosphotransferase [Lentisphaerae bacterium WC36]UDQ98843.1 exopolysaccharide biosynthesis polyprenyl glycosylphosphotransferase [Lentisphaerae bacterium WC36]